MKLDKLKDLILYQSENTNKSIEVLYDNEDFWLTQKTMAELFNVKVNTINYPTEKLVTARGRRKKPRTAAAPMKGRRTGTRTHCPRTAMRRRTMGPLRMLHFCSFLLEWIPRRLQRDGSLFPQQVVNKLLGSPSRKPPMA